MSLAHALHCCEDIPDERLTELATRALPLVALPSLIPAERPPSTALDPRLPLPCPFCGSGALLHVLGIPAIDQDMDPRYVTCDTCGARGPEGFQVEDAITLWNTREECHG